MHSPASGELGGTKDLVVPTVDLSRPSTLDQTERLEMLAASGLVLHRSFDPREILDSFVELVSPRFASFVAVRVFEPEDTARRTPRIVCAIDDRADAELASTIADVCWPRSRASGDRAVLIPDLTVPEARGEWASFVHELAMRTLIATPLPRAHCDAESAGEILFFGRQGRAPYSLDDAAFAEELAARLALALENANKYRRATQAVDAVERTRRSLEEMIRQLPCGLVVADAHSGKIISVNDVARRLALTPSTPGNIADLAYDANGKPIHGTAWPITRALETGQSVAAEEIEWIRPDGDVATLLIGAAPIREESGTVRLAAASIVDITDRKMRERAIEDQLARMTAAELARRKLLSWIAHELRNPLAPALIAFQMMRVQEGIQSARLEMVDRQVHAVRHLIDDLLEAARLIDGTLVLEKRPLDLVELLRDELELHRSRLAREKRSLRLELPSRPIWLLGDARKLARVFDNLLDNAIKFTRPGGQITVGLRVEGDSVVAFVTDDGAGIRAELLPRIFDGLEIERERSAPSTGGLGIGLAIVQRLVALHGGSVEASSAGVGRGAEIRVRLPAAPPAEAPARARSVDNVEGLRVLVVDDNRDTARTLATLLESWGCAVSVAHDGFSALAVERERELDLVLLDIALPEMSGDAVAQALRARSPELPIISVSGLERPAGALSSDVAAHVVKPVDPARLRSLISEVRASEAR